MPLQLPAGREQALLVLLLLHRGEVVSTDRILDVLWGERPPETAGKAVQGYVSHLRRSLGGDLLETRPPGYVLRADDERIDAVRFGRLAADARTALDRGETAAAAQQLDEALALWRGPALADFAYDAFAQAEIQRLEEERLGATEDRLDAQLRLGRHADLAGELGALVAAHPLRERLRGQLMLALYRNGRQAEALEAYREGARRLDDELGLAPGPELQQLERSILNQDPGLDAPARERSLPARKRRRRVIAVVAAAIVAALAAAALALDGGSTKPPQVIPNSLVKIDPETNRIVEVVPVGRGPWYVAAEGEYVWVINWDEETVSRVHTRSLEVATRGGLDRPMGIAFDGDSVWIGSAAGNEATRLDTASMQVREQLTVPVATATLLAVGAGSLWVSSGPLAPIGEVARVSLRDGATETTVTASSPNEVVFGNGAAWFADLSAGTLNRIDAGTNQVQAIDLGSQPINPELGFGSVWVAGIVDDFVWRVDELTTTFRTIDVGKEPWAAAAGAGAVWVTNRQSGSVSRIDPTTNEVVATIEIGFRPHWLAVADGAVWVAVAGRRIQGD